MFCTNCGSEIEKNDSFCPYCGASVNDGSNKDVINEKKPKKILLTIACFIIAIAMMISIYVIFKHSINSDSQICSDSGQINQEEIETGTPQESEDNMKVQREEIQEEDNIKTNSENKSIEEKENFSYIGIVTTKEKVNVRISPSKYADRLGQVDRGTRLNLISDLNNGWCKVEYAGYVGYMMTEYLDKQEFSDEENTKPDYVLEYSSNRYILTDDIKGLSQWECRIARNEIYARHGRLFDDQELQSYFDSCAWYSGTIKPEDFDEECISQIEKANLNILVNYEKEMGWR